MFMFCHHDIDHGCHCFIMNSIIWKTLLEAISSSLPAYFRPLPVWFRPFYGPVSAHHRNRTSSWDESTIENESFIKFHVKWRQQNYRDVIHLGGTGSNKIFITVLASAKYWNSRTMKMELPEPNSTTVDRIWPRLTKISGLFQHAVKWSNFLSMWWTIDAI